MKNDTLKSMSIASIYQMNIRHHKILLVLKMPYLALCLLISVVTKYVELDKFSYNFNFIPKDLNTSNQVDSSLNVLVRSVSNYYIRYIYVYEMLLECKVISTDVTNGLEKLCFGGALLPLLVLEKIISSHKKFSKK